MTVIDLNHGNVETTQRELPKGWRWVRLGEVCKVASGSTPDTTVEDYWDGEIIWVTPQDLGALGSMRLASSSRRITEAGFENCGAEMIPVGSVVMSSRAPIGHLAIADVPLCTNQGCKSFIPGQDVDSLFLYFILKHHVPKIRAMGSGATFTEVSKFQLQRFAIPLPPIEEQREIARQLKRDVDEVARLYTEALRQRKAVEALPSAYLRDAFAGIEAQVWNWERLGDVCTLLPSKSIATEADTEVLAITTACLSEHGFQQSGLKKARMWASDVSECTVIPGEILVARSNTAELVGRATLFSGEVDNVVASDLTIRLWPGPLIFPPFLATYLSFLYQSGYWKERAGGASDSMKKITRSQILRMSIPLPSLGEQNVLVQQFEHNMTVVAQLLEAAQRSCATVEALPNGLLQEIFGDFRS